MRGARVLSIVVSLLIGATSVRAANIDDGWGNLKEVTRGRQYTISFSRRSLRAGSPRSL